VPRFGIVERAFEHSGESENPYRTLAAEARITGPDGRTVRRLPLFWDGSRTWRFRFSPDDVGSWTWIVSSDDPGLDGESGSFRVVESPNAGSIQPMPEFPHHFQRQDGRPFWFMGDTGWALYTDREDERHDRAAVERYIDVRAAQGFNVIHSMLLSEAGWGNQGGPPFEDIGREVLNPAYFQEVDHRLRYLNSRGIIGGLVLAWGNKRDVEPYSWDRFPDLEARRRYARYIAARYSAFDVYFVVAGEWHAEVRARDSTEADLKREFVAIAEELTAADPHERMVAMHPMTRHGSVREFAGTPALSFGDYQQNYEDLHGRVLESRAAGRPVVNSEYAYYLRDQSGDGRNDKPNSATLESIRHATWDIAMAGGSFITGFGTTYFGGNRDPGPFDVAASRNDDWEEDVQHVRTLFAGLEWWKLEPHDELVQAAAERGRDRQVQGVTAPPATAYWALAEPGQQYVASVRGLQTELTLSLGDGAEGRFRVRQFDPRTGRFTDLGSHAAGAPVRYTPPDQRDWVLLVTRAATMAPRRRP
jgi:hypothetical protein